MVADPPESEILSRVKYSTGVRGIAILAGKEANFGIERKKKK